MEQRHFIGTFTVYLFVIFGRAITTKWAKWVFAERLQFEEGPRKCLVLPFKKMSL